MLNEHLAAGDAKHAGWNREKGAIVLWLLKHAGQNREKGANRPAAVKNMQDEIEKKE